MSKRKWIRVIAAALLFSANTWAAGFWDTEVPEANSWYVAVQKTGKTVKIDVSRYVGDVYVDDYKKESLRFGSHEHDQEWERILERIFSKARPYLKVLINYSDGITEKQAAQFIEWEKTWEKKEGTVLLWFNNNAGDKDSLGRKLVVETSATSKFYWDDFPSSWAWKNTDTAVVEKARAVCVDPFQSLQKTITAAAHMTQSGREWEERVRQEAERVRQEAERARLERETRIADAPKILRGYYDDAMRELDENIESKQGDREPTPEDLYFLQYLVPHPQVELSPKAKAVLWEHVKQVKRERIPDPKRSNFLEAAKDGKRLAALYKEIVASALSALKAKERVDDKFQKNAEAFYEHIARSSFAKPEIKRILATLAEKFETDLKASEVVVPEILSYLSEIFEQFNHCLDAQTAAVEMIARSILFHKEEGDGATAQIHRLLSLEKEQVAQEIFPFLYTPSTNKIAQIRGNLKAKKPVSATEKYLYDAYLLNKIAQKIHNNKELQDIPIKYNYFNLCLDETGKSTINQVARDKYESAAALIVYSNYIAEAVGLIKKEIKHPVGGDHAVWQATDRHSVSVPVTVFKNYLDAERLGRLIQTHLRTAAITQAIDSKKKQGYRSQAKELERAHPLSLSAFSSDPSRQWEIQDFYQEQAQFQVAEDLSVSINGRQVMLQRGDVITQSFKEAIEKQAGKPIVGKMVSVWDFSPDAAEKILKQLECLDSLYHLDQQVEIVQRNTALRGETLLVHALNLLPAEFFRKGVELYFPMSISPKSSEDLIDFPERHTLHYSWDSLVTSHNKGNWEEHKYALLQPAKGFQGELFGTKWDDTMIVGYHSYNSKDTVLLVPDDEVESIQSQLKSFSFKGTVKGKGTSLREAIEQEAALRKEKTQGLGAILADAPLDHDDSVFDKIENIYSWKKDLAGGNVHDLPGKTQFVLDVVRNLQTLSTDKRLEKRWDYLALLKRKLLNFAVLLEVTEINKKPIPNSQWGELIAACDQQRCSSAMLKNLAEAQALLATVLHECNMNRLIQQVGDPAIGSMIKIKADGSVEKTQPSNLLAGWGIIEYPNGTRYEKREDGFWTKRYPDGSFEGFNPNHGNSKHTLRIKDHGKEIRIEITNGTSIHQTNADGSVYEAYIEGSHIRSFKEKNILGYKKVPQKYSLWTLEPIKAQPILKLRPKF